MRLKYNLEDRPPFRELLLFGLQWFAVSIPSVVIIGRAVGSLQWGNAADQVIYLQKTVFVVALTLFCQVMWGHGLPLIVGPSTVLLIGVIASIGFPPDTIYTSILMGGALLAILSPSGLFTYVRRLFSPRVVAVVLLLIAFTLVPTVMSMITGRGTDISPLMGMLFSLILILLMFMGQRHFKGVLKSTLILWAMPAGSFAYAGLFPDSAALPPVLDKFSCTFLFHNVTTQLSFDPGVLISFLICIIALAVNDLGSIESMNGILRPDNMGKRVKRGMSLTGLANILSGFLGVVGPVNYSLSPGVIMATGCASRFTLLPAATLLFVLSVSPFAMAIVGSVPTVVIGSILAYILCFQVAAGLAMAFEGGTEFDLETGLIIGLSILLGTIAAFLPPEVVNSLPLILRPLIGNGFVVGVITALLLEHVIFRK